MSKQTANTAHVTSRIKIPYDKMVGVVKEDIEIYLIHELADYIRRNIDMLPINIYQNEDMISQEMKYKMETVFIDSRELDRLRNIEKMWQDITDSNIESDGKE